MNEAQTNLAPAQAGALADIVSTFDPTANIATYHCEEHLRARPKGSSEQTFKIIEYRQKFGGKSRGRMRREVAVTDNLHDGNYIAALLNKDAQETHARANRKPQPVRDWVRKVMG